MKVSRIDAVPLSIPLKRPHRMAIGAISSVEYVVVKVHTDDGLTGIGDAPLEQGPIFSEETIGSVCDVIRRFIAPKLVGTDPTMVRAHSGAWARTIKRNYFAKAAVEMALLDIAGQAAGRPVYDLLGGKLRDSLPLSFSLGTGDPAAEIDEAESHRETGIGIFKIKVGFNDLATDLRRIRKIAEHFGDKIRLRVDANEGWSYVEARKAISVLGDLSIEFLEQPVRRHALAAMAELVKRAPFAIAADESVFGPEDASVVCQSHAADVVSIKIQKAAGLFGSLAVGTICRAAGVGLYLGGMFETGIGTAAALHFGAAAAGLDYGCELVGPPMLAASLVTEDAGVEGGRIHVPRGPGLGVSLDETAVKHYALAVSTC